MLMPRKVTISLTPSRASQLRVLTRTFQAALQSKIIHFRPGSRFGLSLAMLLEVALANAEARELNVDGLRCRLGFTQSSTSRHIAAHMKAGTLECYAPEHDARMTCVRLTKKGVAFIDELLDAMREQVIAERANQATEM